MNTFTTYRAAGLSAIPAIVSEKRPAGGGWKEFQQELPSQFDAESWDSEPIADGVCIICGVVSGGLEMIDFDLQAELFPAWMLIIEQEAPDLFSKLVIETSQSGGMHVAFRSPQPEGNMKLAKGTRGGKLVTLIETRGEGGLFLCAPSPGYDLIQGNFTALPLIDLVERQILLDAAASLNEYFPAPEPPPQQTRRPAPSGEPQGLRPGDDYNARGDPRECLNRAGWTRIRTGDNEYWRRPGKSLGWSATLKDGVFYCWSSNAPPFDAEKGYAPFAVYALLEHNGDYARAASALRAAGYGEQRRNTVQQPTPQPIPAIADDDLPQVDPEYLAPEWSPESAGVTVTESLMDRPTELANAEILIKLHGKDLLYDLDSLKIGGHWLHWNGQIWEVDEEAPAQFAINIARETAARLKGFSAALQHANKMETARGVRGVLDLARRLPGVGIEHTKINADAYLLPCSNVTLDLRTRESRPHYRGDLFTLQAPVTYIPGAECPTWVQFIDQIFAQDAALIDYVQRICGLCLTGDSTVQQLFVFHGEGANGKSTLLDTISGILGPFACRTPDGLLISKGSNDHPCDMMALDGRRMAIASETEEGAKLRIQRVKSLTGDAKFSARGMRENFRDITRSFKLILATNNRPLVSENSVAIWRRIKLIPFRVIIPDEDQDATLLDRLRAEWPGILNWCLFGLQKFQQMGIDSPGVVEDATSGYRDDQDDGFEDFLNSCLLVGEGMSCAKSSVGNEYEKWSKRHNVKRPLDRASLYERLRRMPGVTDDQRRVGGKLTKIFDGIGVTSENAES